MATKAQRREIWQPFLEAELPGNRTVEQVGFHKVWLNNRYQVFVRYLEPDEPGGSFGPTGMVWLSIKRTDKAPIHDWRDLQRIKNELCGREREAVEIYPAESRLVDESNQYHLWVLPTGVRLPFGFNERSIVGPEDAAEVGARQRAFQD